MKCGLLSLALLGATPASGCWMRNELEGRPMESRWPSPPDEVMAVHRATLAHDEARARGARSKRIAGKKMLAEACSDNKHFSECSQDRGSALRLERCLKMRSGKLSSTCERGLEAWKQLLIETAPDARNQKGIGPAAKKEQKKALARAVRVQESKRAQEDMDKAERIGGGQKDWRGRAKPPTGPQGPPHHQPHGTGPHHHGMGPHHHGMGPHHHGMGPHHHAHGSPPGLDDLVEVETIGEDTIIWVGGEERRPSMFSVLADWIFGDSSLSDASVSSASLVEIPSYATTSTYPDADLGPADSVRHDADAGHLPGVARPLLRGETSLGDATRGGRKKVTQPHHTHLTETGLTTSSFSARDYDEDLVPRPIAVEEQVMRLDIGIEPDEEPLSLRPRAPRFDGADVVGDKRKWANYYDGAETLEDVAEVPDDEYYGPDVLGERWWARPNDFAKHSTSSGWETMPEEDLQMFGGGPHVHPKRHHRGDHIRFRNPLPEDFENQRAWLSDSFDVDGDGPDLVEAILAFFFFIGAITLMLLPFFLLGRALKRMVRDGGGGGDAEVPDGYYALPDDAVESARMIASADDDDSIVVTGTPVNPPPSVHL